MDLREREDGCRRHPWELARGRFIRSVLDDHVDWMHTRNILDVGAGDSWFATEVIADAPGKASIVCWDINYDDDDLEVVLPPHVIRTPAPPDGTFDLVLLLDVLEHIEDDASFLDEHITPRLDEQAVLMITVPAYQALYIDHDRALAHFRRYAPSALRALIGARYDVVASGGLFASLLAPRALSALAERLGKTTSTTGIGQWTHGPAVTSLVTRTLDADARLGYWLSRRGRPVPGLSTWIVARPRGSHR